MFDPKLRILSHCHETFFRIHLFSSMYIYRRINLENGVNFIIERNFISYPRCDRRCRWKLERSSRKVLSAFGVATEKNPSSFRRWKLRTKEGKGGTTLEDSLVISSGLSPTTTIVRSGFQIDDFPDAFFRDDDS